jgi:urease accessory protein
MENQFGGESRLYLTTALDSGGQAYLSDVSFTAPFKMQKPFFESGVLQIMPLVASAGLMAGDRQDIRLTVGAGCRVEFTSQSFEKIHKMPEGCAARAATLRVEADAELCYRPLPVLPFAGSSFSSTTAVFLQATSRLAYFDIVACGRRSRDEEFLYRKYRNSLDIYCENELILAENMCFEPEFDNMPGWGMYEGCSHLLTVIFYRWPRTAAPDGETAETAAAELVRRRALIAAADGVEGGVTMNAYGCQVVKALGAGAEQLLRLSDALRAIR